MNDIDNGKQGDRMKEFDVVALGELLVDFTENGFSQQGNVVLEANPGGAPCNVLSMLQNLGRKTAFIGKVGQDALGAMLEEAIISQNINAEYLFKDSDANTTLAFVHTAKDGERSFAFYRNPGADQRLTKEEIPGKLLENTQVFHFGSLSMTDKCNEEATKYALEIAKKANALITFDPNLRPALWKNLEDAAEKMWYGIGQCNVLKIADDELRFLTDIGDVYEGVSILRKRIMDSQGSLPQLICVTLGKEGSIGFYNDWYVKCKPFLLQETIDTTGAGDTFMACIIDSVLRTGIDNITVESLKDSLTFANAAAALITTRRGALKVMPQKEEIDELIYKRF